MTGEPPQQRPPTPLEQPAGQAPAPLPPLRSVHTSNFPLILEELGASLLVTTYQAGKLVILRPDQGVLNTLFCDFQSPMGLAVDGDRLAVGTPGYIWQFRDAPAVGSKLEPVGRHDACFMPRSSHVTGNIHIHEMAWGGPELWLVNTRFSCLCTLDGFHSFVPRWRPSFVTALVPEDRCHLNGLGLAPGERGVLTPRYVTALGTTDTPGGWRANKKDGGLLLDVATGDILTRGLCMPHSPRWYDGKLWVLESGAGGLGIIDPATGRYESIAQMPGFTRGLDFCGPLAFIGLSQVRESAVFSGIPITERPSERQSGVWVVNIHTGEVIAFLKFEDAVQEIFAVKVLPGRRFPFLINGANDLMNDYFDLPDDALRDVPEPLRSQPARCTSANDPGIPGH